MRLVGPAMLAGVLCIGQVRGQGPTIDVWHGPDQTFGSPGVPQRWVNILGNASDPDGVAGLSYRLNNGEIRPLSLGPDTRRLLLPGDFNIDVDYADLLPGPNEIEIFAMDVNSNGSATAVTVNYAAGNTWPLPYGVDWSNVQQLSDAVQIVDGKWGLSSNGVRPIEVGYDRGFVVGDRYAWTDYEILLPITIHSIDPLGYLWPSVSPGVGIMFRWQGHTKWGDWQPWIFWRPNGASAWYDYIGGPHLEMQGDTSVIAIDTSGRTLDYDTPYYWKVRVETVPDTGSVYCMKVWEVGTAEPVGWDLTGWQGLDDVPCGSILVLAHHVDATFGNIAVAPVSGADPPVLYNVVLEPHANWATVRWTTDVPTHGSVAYGGTAAYELGVVSDPALALDHSLTLMGLDPQSTYHVQITSERPGGVAASTGDLVFETLPPDTTPPAVGAIAAATDKFSAVVTWTTDEPTTGVVTYGLTSAHEIGSVVDGVTGFAHSVTITGLSADTLYHFEIVAQDQAGNPGASGNRAFETLPVPLPNVVSDEFCCVSLDTEVWTFINPRGDGSYAMTGGRIAMSVPEGVSHDVWAEGNFAPRIMQPAADTDFEIQARFDSPVTTRYQMQGILVEQDADNYVRFDIHYATGTTRAFGSTMINGEPVARFNVAIPDGSPVFMQIERTGDTWTYRYSYDGALWETAGSFSKAITVTSAGVFVGNQGFAGQPPPAFTTLVDYFYSVSDILAGAVPGDCAALFDCNTNGVPDFCDVRDGTSADADSNGVPDECGDLCMVNGEPVDCSHLDSDCTLGICDPHTGQCIAQPVNEAGLCDDGDPCTLGDHCAAGRCRGTYSDADNDGRCDGEDNCPTAWNPDQADADGDDFGDACDGPFDADHDGDVDDEDHVHFESCLGGPGTAASLPCLDVHDQDEDDDVDLLDWAEFQTLFDS
ncbi:MAG: DUF1349 domain-containing protein [Phycisphaerae bacterium]|nr:DUF1349 domain-containing protein [Phycisphaerae bacterium]